MTLRYSEMSQHDTLYNVARAYPGGIEALAQRMGKSVNVLRNKLRPGIDSHHVNFEEVSAIIELCQEAHVPDALSPLFALNARHGLEAFALPSVDSLSDEELTQTVCKAMKKFGDLAANTSAAMMDHIVTSNEMDGIEKDFQQVMAAVGEWRERLRVRAEQDGKRGAR